MKSWIPVAVASISALGALLAAVIAYRSARRTERAALQASRILELERRLSVSRAEVFEPMVEALFRFWELASEGVRDAERYESEVNGPLRRFEHWVQIYGSDEAVRGSVRLRQAMFHNAPEHIVTRLMGDLVVIARRELGDPDTTMTPLEVVAARVNDIYEDERVRAALTDPFDEVVTRYGWTPPWPREALPH